MAEGVLTCYFVYPCGAAGAIGMVPSASRNNLLNVGHLVG